MYLDTGLGHSGHWRWGGIEEGWRWVARWRQVFVTMDEKGRLPVQQFVGLLASWRMDFGLLGDLQIDFSYLVGGVMGD